MLHSYVHGGLCVAIQYNDVTLVINPTLDNVQQKQRIDQHPGLSYLYTQDTSTHTVIPDLFSLKTIETSIVITVAGLSILYYHAHTPLTKVAGLSDLDLLFVDFCIGMDAACHIASSVVAKTVVPINLTHSDDPIGFCREVMLHHRGVPKYLKNGQYIVHDRVG